MRMRSRSGGGRCNRRRFCAIGVKASGLITGQRAERSLV